MLLARLYDSEDNLIEIRELPFRGEEPKKESKIESKKETKAPKKESKKEKAS